MTGTAARIARNVVWLGMGEALLKGTLFVAGVVVARGLGQEALGVFTVGFGAALVLMQVCAGGQVEVLIRETARQPGAARGLYQQARRWQRGLGAVVLPAVVLAAVIVVRDEPLRWALVAFAPYAWLRAWLITAGAVFKGQDRMDVEVGARTLEVSLALVVLLLIAGLGAPVWMTGAAFTVGAWAGAVWIVSRLGRLPWAEAPPFNSAELARQGWPFLALAVLTQFLLRGDVLVQASLGVAAADTGLYGAAAAPVWGVFGLAQLVAVAAYPTVARRAAAGRLGIGLVLLLAGAGAGLGAALAVGIWLIRRPLMVGVFGPSFAGAVELLTVLAWALPGACAAVVLGIVAAACRRQKAALTVQALVVVVSLAGNFRRIPVLGVEGSAQVAVVAHLVSALLMAGLTVRAVRSNQGVSPTSPAVTSVEAS